MKKILIATGGTGGHTFVAHAIAEKLRQYNIKTVFTTSELNPLTFNLCPSYHIHTKGLVGTRFLSYWGLFPISLFESIFIMLKEKPDAILGTGSYASIPPALASRLFFIPLFITEIDSVPGRATKFLSMFASSIYTSFKEAGNELPKKKLKRYGCPIRNLRVLDKAQAKKELGFDPSLPLVFVFGGSGGALGINNLIIEIIPLMHNIQFAISTGKRDYEKICTRVKGKNAKIYSFIEDIGLLYSASDIVISRAGALAIAELVKFKKPAILIPYPYAAKKHQQKNARLMEKMGCAIMLENPSSGQLMEKIYLLLKPDVRRSMTEAFPLVKNSSEEIAKDIKLCLHI